MFQAMLSRLFLLLLLASTAAAAVDAGVISDSEPKVWNRTHHPERSYFYMRAKDHAEASKLAEKHGLSNEGHLQSFPCYYVLSKHLHDEHSMEHSIERRSLDSELQAYPIRRKKLFKRAPIVDTAVHSIANPAVVSNRIFEKQTESQAVDLITMVRKKFHIEDPLFNAQWHLLNLAQPGNDLNVTGVWAQDITGQGVNVAIIDDGIDHENPDIKGNYYAKGSYNFNDNDDDPRPRLNDDYHGTRCAGEIAAVSNNVCGIGVAYKAKVSGIRILSKEVTSDIEAESLVYDMENNHIYSCSWGPSDDGETVDGPDHIVAKGFQKGVNEGRGGKGSIYVFASGNGGAYDDNCNYDGYTNGITTITISAIDRMDTHPVYSERCSAALAVTYSSGHNSFISTTDASDSNGPRCANNHSGTSAAAPLAAGVYALVLSVRPDLTWRDLQHLQVRSAVTFDDAHDDWQLAGDGKRRYSHVYGYGKLDAYRIVEMAKSWKLVKPQSWLTSPKIVVNKPIFDAQYPEYRSVFQVTEEMVKNANLDLIEHVTVTVSISHRFRGNIAVDLVSPHNVTSRLADGRRSDYRSNPLYEWTFMSVMHWDENPVGNWTLVVKNAHKISEAARMFVGRQEPVSESKFSDWRLVLWGSASDARKVTQKYQLINEIPHETVDEAELQYPIRSTPWKDDDTHRVSDGMKQNATMSPDSTKAERGTISLSQSALASLFLIALAVVLSLLTVKILIKLRRQKNVKEKGFEAVPSQEVDDDTIELYNAFHTDESDGETDQERKHVQAKEKNSS